MPFGMEVGLGPGDFVFDGDPAIPRTKGTPTSPNFWRCGVVASVVRRMNEVTLRRARLVLDG